MREWTLGEVYVELDNFSDYMGKLFGTSKEKDGERVTNDQVTRHIGKNEPGALQAIAQRGIAHPVVKVRSRADLDAEDLSLVAMLEAYERGEPLA